MKAARASARRATGSGSVRDGSAGTANPPVQPDPAAGLPRHHDLTVEHATGRQFGPHRFDEFGEVPAEVLSVAGLDHHLVGVAEHQRAEAVPLRLERPHPGFGGHRRRGLGQHRLHRRHDGEVHPFHVRLPTWELRAPAVSRRARRPICTSAICVPRCWPGCSPVPPGGASWFGSRTSTTARTTTSRTGTYADLRRDRGDVG